jgi:hypothetical protein
MNKKESFLKPDLLPEQSIEGQEEKNKDISQEKLTQSDLAELYKFANEKIKEMGDRVTGVEADADGEEIAKIKQELSNSLANGQEVVSEDFERLSQLSLKSKQVLESFKKGVKKAVAVGVLMASLSMPNFSSEARADVVVDEHAIERQIETGKLEIRELRPGMIVDRKELKKCLHEASHNEPNEWIVVIAWKKGADEKQGRILEISGGGQASAFSDLNLTLDSLKEGEEIESIHTHSRKTGEQEFKKTSAVPYDSEKFACPPSFGDLASAYSNLEFYKGKGLEHQALSKRRELVVDVDREWEYGVEEENNPFMKKFSSFINSWRDKRNEAGKAIIFSQEEVQAVNNFADEIKKNRGFDHEFTQTLQLFFESKAREVNDEKIKAQCLGIADKAKQVTNEACRSALKENNMSQEELDLIVKSEGLALEIYGVKDAEKASHESREQKIEELKACYKKFGVFLKYTENKKK